MAKLIHTMIRVRDLERSLEFYSTCFGMQVSHRLDFPDFTLAYLCNDEAEAEIELTWNRGRNAPYTHGDGYGHVAFCVDDLEATHSTLVRQGRSPNDIKTFHDDAGVLLARFFFVLDPDGYKIEVLERHGHYR